MRVISPKNIILFVSASRVPGSRSAECTCLGVFGYEHMLNFLYTVKYVICGYRTVIRNTVCCMIRHRDET